MEGNRKKPEILAPASSLEVLKTAVYYGADAVYIGGEMYGLRAKAKNFSPEDMKAGIEFAHKHGRKVYVTANITAHDRDLEGVELYFKELEEMNPDALIISDPGVFSIAKKVCPDIDIHISTQANNVNHMTFRFWHELGATRVVTARELSISEIADINAHIPEKLEIETFIHGAMCISYSGRCLLSNYFTGRDANLGACTHPCRWKYYIMEENRPGEYLPVEENERGTYIFNSKDLCMIEHIPELVAAGVDSFKIEGRMKTALYVAVVVRTYRQALDDYWENPEKYKRNITKYKQEIAKCTYRQFTTGFFFGKPTHEAQIYDHNTYTKGATYLGRIQEVTPEGTVIFEQKNKFSVGDIIEVMKKDGENRQVRVLSMTNSAGEEVESCPHPGEIIRMKTDALLSVGEIMRGIERVPVLKKNSDALSADVIKTYLSEKNRDREIIVCHSTNSTNTEVKERAANGAGEGLVVLAEEQTEGRGRLGRDFFSPKGTGIYMSFLFQPLSDLSSNIVSVTTASAVAVCRAIRKTLHLEPEIKWVNDIYLNGKKICGILTEAVTDSESGQIGTVAVGIGINYRSPEKGFPEELKQTAGSLCGEEGSFVSRNELAAAIIEEMQKLYEDLTSGKHMDDYRRFSLVLGKKVTYMDGENWETGTAIDVENDGGLIVEKEDGSHHVLRTGEITLRMC